MKNEPSEVDMIIHWMRQSKMDKIRVELMTRLRKAEKGNMGSRLFLDQLMILFRDASNNAPLP